MAGKEENKEEKKLVSGRAALGSDPAAHPYVSNLLPILASEVLGLVLLMKEANYC